MANKANDKNLQYWKIYALGGGLGHLQRSIALSRRAIRKGHYVDILCNSRFSKFIPWNNELKKSGSLTIIDNQASIEMTSSRVLKWIMDDNFDQLIVDTLPRGITGELVDIVKSIQKPKTFIHRDLKQKYVEKYNLNEFIKSYNLIIIPGEKNPIKGLNKLPFCHTTEPWLIRDHNEIIDKDLARIKFGMSPSDKRYLAIIPLTGDSEEEKFFRNIHLHLVNSVKNWAFKLISPVPDKSDLCIWPIMELMNGVDLIIGAGGYNTVSESRATKTPLLGKPLDRIYDIQKGRLQNDQMFMNVEEIIKCLPKFERNSRSDLYVNGTYKSVELIESLLI